MATVPSIFKLRKLNNSGIIQSLESLHECLCKNFKIFYLDADNVIVSKYTYVATLGAIY